MAKTTKLKNILKLSEFPERKTIEKTEDCTFKVTEYGDKSYTDQLAVVTHFLHNVGNIGDSQEKRETNLEAVSYIRDYLYYVLPDIDLDKATMAAENPVQYSLFEDFFDVPYPDPKKPKFTFIDLFAGMGGFRLAMQKQGGKCVFSSEWNKYSQKTYFANFGDMPFGDITKEETKKYIPQNFDILCAGFPCQPFSIAGVS